MAEAGPPVISFGHVKTRNRAQHEDELAKPIAERDGVTAGIVCLISAVEPCMSFRDSASHETHCLVRDDVLVFTRNWDFDLADARNVTLWQGDRDDNVVPANATGLADRVPISALRPLPGERHMSIGLRVPQILHDLLTRAQDGAQASEVETKPSRTSHLNRSSE